ncbi:MAG: hypothetical protein JF564_01735 [Sphingomonas sp.]|nr:hypothetical protein [Sphingomonas sp.]
MACQRRRAHQQTSRSPHRRYQAPNAAVAFRLRLDHAEGVDAGANADIRLLAQQGLHTGDVILSQIVDDLSHFAQLRWHPVGVILSHFSSQGLGNITRKSGIVHSFGEAGLSAAGCGRSAHWIVVLV